MPTFTRLDNIDQLSFLTNDHEMIGTSFHIEGSPKEVVTMLRRVNMALHNDRLPEYAGLHTLLATVYQHGGVLSAEVVAMKGEEKGPRTLISMPVRPQKVVRREPEPEPMKEVKEVKEEVKEEPTHSVPNVAAEPSDYVMKEGRDGEKESRVESGYHGTRIAPHEQTDDYETREWKDDDAFDYHCYFSDTDRGDEWSVEDQPKVHQRYVSYSEQRHRELHKRPEKHVTWDEIRKRSWSVCWNKETRTQSYLAAFKLAWYFCNVLNW